jgi:methylmalonyl-CoA mutase
VAYLRALTAAGLDVDAAARLLELRLAVTAEQFPTIAKLRAARRLWSRVLEASGAGSDTAPGTAPAVHAVASPTMYTRRDPYVNLLRGTVAGFAAGVGGADAVTVAPFDAALGSSTPFSRRIARNTQSLLVMEAHLARVIDPAGGSWFVESLTDELARAAWAFFQELEAAGGVVAALDSGLVAERTAAVRAGREKEAATRRAPVTGVSEFADLHEKLVPRSGPDLLAGLGLGRGPGGLPVHRPAAAYEAFRDRSDAHLAATGARPCAFLATLGPLATHAARAGFARNLLHGGGIDTVDAGPTDAVDDVVAAFRDAGTPVAVLCSSDALYAERAAPVVAALRKAGARHVLLAGTAQVDGLDGYLQAGGDALAVLDGLYAAIDPKEVAQ